VATQLPGIELDQWLIRTAQNWIAGPYKADQVRQMILDRKLTLQDEVCSANGYWVYLHEREEILQQLGIEVPPPGGPSSDEEITETQTDLDNDTTDPNLSLLSDSSLMEMEALAQSTTESTGVFNTQIFKKKPAASAVVSTLSPVLSSVTPSQPKVEIVGQNERSSTRKGIILAFVVVTVLISLFAVSFLKR
jgi:hypothetical protein